MRSYKLLAAAFAALPLASCLDSDSSGVAFGFRATGVIVQGVNDDGATTLTPYIKVLPTTGYTLRSVSISNTKTGLVLQTDTVYGVFETVASSYALQDTARLNGEYVVVATATTRETETATLSISVSDARLLSPIVPSSLSYDGSYLRASAPAVKNAAVYGFVVTPYDRGNEPRRVSAVRVQVSNVSTSADNVVSYYYPFSRSALGSDFAEVRAYAAGEGGIYVESGEAMTVECDEK